MFLHFNIWEIDRVWLTQKLYPSKFYSNKIITGLFYFLNMFFFCGAYCLTAKFAFTILKVFLSIINVNASSNQLLFFFLVILVFWELVKSGQ